jgi:hypothetical protein
MRLTDLVPILQMAIGPVILISGGGLLLLSMTNRMGRIIDRSRLLAESLRKPTQESQPRITAQLKVLARRARLLQLAIILTTLSMLLAAVLVIVLFMAAVFRLDLAALVILVFTGCLLCLVASLIAFIMDIDLALAALKLEVAQVGESV